MLSLKHFGFAFVIAIALLPATSAQTVTGTISGTVRDQSGAVMSGVTVAVQNTATGLERQTSTGASGEYTLAALPYGAYKLRTEKAGFQTAVTDVTVAVDQIRTVDITMNVGAQTQQVSVQGAMENVNAETTQLGAVVNHRDVVELPLNGRDFTQLARIQPGVASSGGGGGQQGGEGGASNFSSNGQRSSSNNFLINGVDNNNYVAGAVAIQPSIDSIEEFNVQTNTFSAEYGRNSGAIVNLITRSGTNDLHGSLYEFFRNDALDARNFFAPVGFATPELRLNQFGGTLGGPIKKDRTFFFINYEGFRRVAGITLITNVPTLAERQGIFPTGSGQTVTVPVNPVSARLFQLYPIPNLNSPLGNFVSSPNLRQHTDQGLVKVDHHFSNNDILSFRYSESSQTISYPFTPGQSSTSIPGYGIVSPVSSILASLNYIKPFGPHALNEARLGFNREHYLSSNQEGPQAATYGINTGYAAGTPNGLGNIPFISFSGGLVSGGSAVSNLGGTDNNPSGSTNNTFQYVDQFSYTVGRHSWKFGADIRRLQINRIYDLAFSGELVFDGARNPQGIANALVDFAEGLPESSLQFVGDSERGLRTSSFNFFAQDTFKWRPNLVINYGLRYELNTVLHDVNGLLSNFFPQDFQTYFPPTASQTDLAALQASGVLLQRQASIYQGNHLNFAPRVGIAYSLGQRYHTVFRIGYGIFYDTIIGNIPGNVALNPPYLPDYYNSAPSIGWPNAFGPTAFPVLTTVNPNIRTPYAQDYNFNIQQELPWNMLATVSYVGTHGTHLSRFTDANQPYITQAQLNSLTPSLSQRLAMIGVPAAAIPILESNIGNLPGIVRNQYFGFPKILTAVTDVNSEYNSLQATLSKQLAQGLSFQVNYTFSKSIDEASDFYGSGANGTTVLPQNNFNLLAGERGLSDFDIRHRFSASFIYQLPAKQSFSGATAALVNGWELAGIVTLQTGQPFSVLTGLNNSRTGEGNDRPNVITNPNSGSHTVEQWFDTAAFVPNAILTFGNAGRNIVTGPGFDDVDFSVIKNTHFGEKTNLQFRAEFFNLFNHPNFAIPNNVESAPSFGAVYETPDVAQNNVGLGSGGPRLIQLALKLMF
ncbi:MAG TPA: carboxypeptidase regulatory-like domain-containing protein [Bryobacteraceae bacterium]|nr:carboxypeptidase regulatory-like domain-containing protein [Bryobacteraceae bacterium]